MSRHDRARFVVTCPDCAVRKAIDDADEAVAFYRRHHSITGHDVEWERADADLAVPGDDIASVIAGLETRLEGGVPLGLLSAAMGERGATIGETLEAVRELRMEGKLYEPRDDRLRVT